MISFSILDNAQLGLALLAVICLIVVYWRGKKAGTQGPQSISSRFVPWFSWILIIILAINLGWLAGRWLGELQKPIKILFPTAGQVVDLRLLVSGRSSLIPSGQELWLIISARGSGQYFPAAAQAVIQPGGGWSSLGFIGSDNDHGRTFDLMAVLVDADAAAILSENSQVGLAELPPGCLVVDQIAISRK